MTRKVEETSGQSWLLMYYCRSLANSHTKLNQTYVPLSSSIHWSSPSRTFISLLLRKPNPIESAFRNPLSNRKLCVFRSWRSRMFLWWHDGAGSLWSRNAPVLTEHRFASRQKVVTPKTNLLREKSYLKTLCCIVAVWSTTSAWLLKAQNHSPCITSNMDPKHPKTSLIPFRMLE